MWVFITPSIQNLTESTSHFHSRSVSVLAHLHHRQGLPPVFPSIHTCKLTDSVGLPVVLAQVGVNEVHNVRADGSLEHSGQGDIFAQCFPLLRVHRDQWPSASLGKEKEKQLSTSKVSFLHSLFTSTHYCSE